MSDSRRGECIQANDCDDLDSIHNDGERHMPYIMLWPDAERSKLAAWAHNQATSGALNSIFNNFSLVFFEFMDFSLIINLSLSPYMQMPQNSIYTNFYSHINGFFSYN